MDLMKQYIEYVSDRLLLMLGLDKEYNSVQIHFHGWS